MPSTFFARMNALSFLLIFCCLICPFCAQAEEVYAAIPAALRFTQSFKTEDLDKYTQIRRAYPSTANAQVDAAVRTVIDEMTASSRAYLTQGTKQKHAILDVGSIILRTGTSWMSFLTEAHVTEAQTLTHMEMDARVYDMESGKQLTLRDLFSEESKAWDIMQDAVRAQLSSSFSEETQSPDFREKLAALCEPEAIMQADFTLGAAYLTLSYRADALFPEKHALIHVRLPYSQLRPLMTPSAQAQTDNRRYKMVALTYDDGPAPGNSRRLLDELRNFGAQATFFYVGKSMTRSTDSVLRAHNGLHSTQSHTYTHAYPEELDRTMIAEEKAKMELFFTELIGHAPTMLRAPGGSEQIYQHHRIGYPLIHWSLASADSGNPDEERIAKRVIRRTAPGDIVLMHEINIGAPRYTRRILQALSEQDYLFVTVDELFAVYGIDPITEAVYFSPNRVETAL